MTERSAAGSTGTSAEAALLKRLFGLNLQDQEAVALVARYRDKRTGKFNGERFMAHMRDRLALSVSKSTALELEGKEQRHVSLAEPEELVKWGKMARYKALKKAQHEREQQATAAEGEAAVSNVTGEVQHVAPYYEQILAHIRKGVLSKMKSMHKQDLLKNTFSLLAEHRSPHLNPSQLKAICLYRLNVSLTDQQVAVVFDHLDTEGKGLLPVKDLVHVIVKDAYGNHKMTIEIPPNPPKVFQLMDKSYVHNQAAQVSYDHKFTGLVPPEPENSLYIPALRDLEIKIFDKIFERTHQGANMYQQLIRCFSSGRDKSQRLGISRDQMRYTLWKIFQLNVSNEIIEHLFKRYDTERSGHIPMQIFCDAIMAIGNINEPLVEDLYAAGTGNTRIQRKDSDTTMGVQLDPDEHKDFLRFIRKRFRDKINAEGRAPHYLVNCAERMALAQAKAFLEEKFDAQLSDFLYTELCKIYHSKGLFNMKLLLRDALGLQDTVPDRANPNMLSGNTVKAEEMPSTMRYSRQSAEDIHRLFALKITERLKGDQPMSSVHKLFKLKPEDGDVRYIDRHVMRSVMSKFDILPSEQDFDRFFQMHVTRADGLVELRPFLVELLGPGKNPKSNPFLPKDAEEVVAQRTLAQVISNMTGQMRRQVPCLNGPAHTRFVADGVQGDSEAAEEAKQLLEIATVRSPQKQAAAAAAAASSSSSHGGHGGHTPKPPGAAADAGQKPRRPISAPPSMQTAQHLAHRSPRAASHHVRSFIDVSQGEWNGGDGDGDVDDDDDDDLNGFESYDGDGAATRDDRSNRARVDWDVDNSDRDADWSHLSSAKNGPSQPGQVSLPPPGIAGATATGGRPYLEAPNETVARRRVPHVSNWPQTDPHQPLLSKKYKVALQNVKTSKEEYGLFNKDLNKQTKKEAQMRERTEDRLQSELQRRARLLVAQRNGFLR